MFNSANAADRRSMQGGFIGLLSIVIAGGIIGYLMYMHFEKNPRGGQNAVENGRAVIDVAKDMQVQAELKAKATNAMMGM